MIFSLQSYDIFLINNEIKFRFYTKHDKITRKIFQSWDLDRLLHGGFVVDEEDGVGVDVDMLHQLVVVVMKLGHLTKPTA